ncbi:MAG TPA: hypothetical protein VJY35_08915 [Candidatus Eisenbacteria bacterium]|nr:hypothetical protein [Candidatus Eisenbacteria bacterium]
MTNREMLERYLESEALADRISAMARSTGDPRPLHLVTKREWPRALCGYVVSDEFNPTRTDTAGRDRCPECLRVAAQRARGAA